MSASGNNCGDSLSVFPIWKQPRVTPDVTQGSSTRHTTKLRLVPRTGPSLHITDMWCTDLEESIAGDDTIVTLCTSLSASAGRTLCALIADETHKLHNHNHPLRNQWYRLLASQAIKTRFARSQADRAGKLRTPATRRKNKREYWIFGVSVTCSV